MNNFNTVFLAVKELCKDKDVINDPKCFEALARTTKIPVNRLDFYLGTLESMGIIRYSIDQGSIKLTKYGKLKEQLFTV